jgi:hypothetical protein
MFLKWMLRKGAVGGTVKWVVNGYIAWHQKDSSLSLEEIIQKLIEARCSVMHNKDEFETLLAISDPMKGLHGLVMSLLSTEASYLENTPQGKVIILDVVYKELIKSGLPSEVLFGKV